MHQSSRREFVVAVTAATPLLLLQPAPVLAQSSSSTDPVLDAMLADIRDLVREGNEKVSARRSSVAGLEALTGAVAAHLGQHYDGKLKADIRRLGRNRQAFVQEVTTKLNKPEFTHERVEATMKALEKDGLKGALLESRKALKRVRQNAPEIVQVKRVQYDGCANLRFEMELAQMMAGIACTLAIAFGGTNAAIDGACITMGTVVVFLQAVLWWYGC